MHFTQHTAAGIAAAIACSWCMNSAAQPATPYPQKPVKVIVGLPPASGAENMARVISQKLGDARGQQFPVDNRPGAGSSIAAGLAAKSAADGHTWFIGTIANAINASLYAKLPFDFTRDLTAIAPGGSSPDILVMHPSVAVRNVADLIELAKSKPRQMSFGSSSIATLQHLAAEMFNDMAGFKLNHIPYKSSPQATVELIGRQFEMMFGIGAPAMPEVKNDRLRALAVTTSTRLPALPDLPTVAESGLQGVEAVTWLGFVAPAGRPREIIVKLNTPINRVTVLREVQQQLAAPSIDAMSNSPQQFANHIRGETTKWARVVKSSGARAE